MLDGMLTALDKQFLINLVLSMAAGYLIGAERESRGKDADISTHTFVITGSMLFTMLSIAVEPNSTARIASQIVVGIGFLGAGLILKEHNKVKNLTTAASIWFGAGIGMALGFGYTFIAVIATLLSIIMPRIPHLSKQTIPSQRRVKRISRRSGR